MNRSLSFPFHTFLSLALTLLVACEGSNNPEGEPVQGLLGVSNLLGAIDEMDVREAPEGFPPRLHLMRTGQGSTDGRGPLPCIQVRPKTVLALPVPPPPPGAVLEIALGIRSKSYRGQGQVTFRGTLEGEPLFERRIDCSAEVPQEEQRWQELEIPLSSGGELLLCADYEGSEKKGPVVGFGRLRISLPYETHRQRASREKPNIVLVVIDTLRADRLSCYGSTRKTSPTLDRLAAKGTLFERAYCSSTWTIPGTTSILTGLSAPEHGLGIADSSYLPDAIETLPRLFARAGFVTAGFATNPLITASRNFDQGFETFQNKRWAPLPTIAQQVRKWIASVGERRFFLYLHASDPHAPYKPSTSAMAHLEIEPQEEFAKTPTGVVVGSWYARGETDRALIERANTYGLDLYDAEIYQCDQSLGAIFRSLEKSGHGEDTVICITADHGEEFLDHDLIGHYHQLYPETTHIPLILWGPGIPRGKRVSLPVENRRVAPTLLALGGVDPPEAMGHATLLRDSDLEHFAARGVFASANMGRVAHFDTHEYFDLGPMHSMIDGPWQLLTCPESGSPGHGYTKLFDLRSDPFCHQDLSGQHPDRVKTMLAAIQAWLDRCTQARPAMVQTTEETRDLLRSIGYLGEDE